MPPAFITLNVEPKDAGTLTACNPVPAHPLPRVHLEDVWELSGERLVTLGQSMARRHAIKNRVQEIQLILMNVHTDESWKRLLASVGTCLTAATSESFEHSSG